MAEMKRKRKKRKESLRVAVHTSTLLAEMSIPEMETLVRESLQDAFLPKMLIVKETPEKADEACAEIGKDPYWQSRYRSISASIIEKRYKGMLPVVTQYQMDTCTLVSCFKVESSISFSPVFNYEGQHPIKKRSDLQVGSDMFFGLFSERDAPNMKKWDDMRWDEFGVVPKHIFYLFIQILLHRLEPILLRIWEAADGHVSALGFDQDIVKGTYFDVLKKHAQNS